LRRIHGNRTGESLWPYMLRIGLNAGAEWFVVEQPPGNAAWEAEVADDLSELAATSPDLSSALATLVRRIFAGECSWLPAPACRDWRSPGSRSHERLTKPRGQQMPEVIGTRISSQLYQWMLGLPVSSTRPRQPSRRERIEALGDSNPPHMAEAIGRDRGDPVVIARILASDTYQSSKVHLREAIAWLDVQLGIKPSPQGSAGS
jgi:hypothetical protein